MSGQVQPIVSESARLPLRTRYSDGTLTLSASSNGRFATLDGTTEPYTNCEAVAWKRGGVNE